MNHQKVYDVIIEKARSENRIKLKKGQKNYVYYEKHHIIPKCLSGTNDKENLVLLTAREHFICHKLLTYIHKDNRKIACAFHLMTFMNKRKYGITSRDYAYAIELFKNTPVSEETKQKISKSNKGKTLGKKRTVEQRERMKAAQQNREHKPLSIETKNKIKKSWEKRKITPVSEETKEKMSKSHIGKKMLPKSHETRKKLSDSLKGRKAWNKNKKMTEEQTKNMHKQKSQEHIKKVALTKMGNKNMKGKRHSQETKDKMRNAKLGIKHTKEHNENFSKSRKGISITPTKKLLCSNCNKIIDKRNYNRWHGDNCKHKSI